MVSLIQEQQYSESCATSAARMTIECRRQRRRLPFAKEFFIPACFLRASANEEDEICKDILSVKGQKDIYYYSEELMAHNYAKIAMLTLEKDDARTVAEMVRFNCKAFPTPTPVYYFSRQPFFLDKERMRLVIAQMREDPDYQDIRECKAEINGEPYLYSIDLMSERYAKALANGAESHEADE